MQGTLRLLDSVLAFEDLNSTSNPQQRYVDWTRNIQVSVQNPKQQSFIIQPADTLTVFNGTRSTSIDNTTQFNLTISPLSSSIYRFTWTGIGTAPAFRTDRAVTPNGHTLTWSINTNQTATLVSSASDFSAVQNGDILFVPGVTTGDSSGPFNPLNEGFWVVIGSNGTTTLQLDRPAGMDFAGIGEVVVAPNNTCIGIFSQTGVQIGDSVSITNGWAAPVLGNYIVTTVTPGWIEVNSSISLPVSQLGIPTASGMSFFTNAKRYLFIESDQDVVIRLNGDSTDINRLSPWLAGDATLIAQYIKTGMTWSCVIVNKSSVAANVIVVSAE